MDDLLKVIDEVDENGNGVVEFDEFVFMISNMRSGKSSFKLSMLLNLLPDGNEVSENGRNRMNAHGVALRSANVRYTPSILVLRRPAVCGNTTFA